MSNPGLPRQSSSRQSSEFSNASFDDIPEAQREVVEPPSSKPQKTVLWVGLGAIALLLGGIGIIRLTRTASDPAATTTAGLTTRPNSKAELEKAKPAPDGRVLNHYPYKEAVQGNLDPITSDNMIRLHYKAAKAYKQMAADARAEGVVLVPLSGFRSVDIQEDLFFNVGRERNQRPQERASVSAPPGHSEHHTGYAVDIGDGDVPAVNLSQNFENTSAFRWLDRNAARYSFELSFPKGNEQGVSYEPWHWRYVGDSTSLATFYKARNVKPTQ